MVTQQRCMTNVCIIQKSCISRTRHNKTHPNKPSWHVPDVGKYKQSQGKESTSNTHFNYICGLHYPRLLICCAYEMYRRLCVLDNWHRLPTAPPPPKHKWLKFCGRWPKQMLRHFRGCFFTSWSFTQGVRILVNKKRPRMLRSATE